MKKTLLTTIITAFALIGFSQTAILNMSAKDKADFQQALNVKDSTYNDTIFMKRSDAASIDTVLYTQPQIDSIVAVLRAEMGVGITHDTINNQLIAESGTVIDTFYSDGTGSTTQTNLIDMTFSNWSTSNPDWEGDDITISKTASTNGGAIEHVGFPGATVGNDYTITYTLSNTNGNPIKPILGTTVGTARTTDGTYTETLTLAGYNAVGFAPTWNTECDITDVILTEAL